MALPKAHGVRLPAVAGPNRFYPADATQCRAWAQKLVNVAVASREGVKTGIGGIVPHAGWICSGAIAGETIAALRSSVPDAELVVVFGAIHTPIPTARAALDSNAKWLEPGGESLVSDEVRIGLAEKSNWFVIDDRFHASEHAVEVELPLIEVAWPEARILPVEVPLAQDAIEVGRETARRAMQLNRRAVFLASSDLTHYGPNYNFAPAGIGMHGIEWAKQNDQRLLDRVQKFEIEAIVPEVAAQLNACGGGAIAAMMSACREYGAGSATVLRHANSFETLQGVIAQRPDNAVGYAAVVVG
jgi:AmmeMemoRadiSam system protein B